MKKLIIGFIFGTGIMGGGLYFYLNYQPVESPSAKLARFEKDMYDCEKEAITKGPYTSNLRATYEITRCMEKKHGWKLGEK